MANGERPGEGHLWGLQFDHGAIRYGDVFQAVNRERQPHEEEGRRAAEPKNQENDPEDPEYLPEENADDQDSGDDEPDNIITRDDWYED
ncbi:hypothetical protein U9M48_037110 [Paspalum notatum var. saurae]|uniref:Uncharacterized protein n=1 Tax=Paspalum notatum var. saurae TaxID=547442 RepID=A0AAQ3XAQ8_PASNO